MNINLNIFPDFAYPPCTGICYVIFIDKVKEGKRTHLLVEYMNPINSSGVPERFGIYLLPTNE